MYKIVEVVFPYIEDGSKGKSRPVIVLTKAYGKYKVLVVAYITTKLDEMLETDIVLDANERYFSNTGLLHTSVIRLHKLTSLSLDSVGKELGEVPATVQKKIQSSLKTMFF